MGTCHSGYAVSAINGLCARGTVDPINNTTGFVAFMRADKNGVNDLSSDQNNFYWYRENLLLPLISNCRVKQFKYKVDTPIPDKLTAVC